MKTLIIMFIIILVPLSACATQPTLPADQSDTDWKLKALEQAVEIDTLRANVKALTEELQTRNLLIQSYREQGTNKASLKALQKYKRELVNDAKEDKEKN